MILLAPIVILVLLLSQPSLIHGHHTTICWRPPGNWHVSEPNHTGLGVDRFPVGAWTWESWWWKDTDYKWVDGDRSRYGFIFTLHPVFRGVQPMNGWFRLKLSYYETDPNYSKNLRSRILTFTLSAQNENYEFVGEWLTDDQFNPENFENSKKNDCPNNDATRYMSITCGGAYPTQPMVANTLVYIANITKHPDHVGHEFPHKKYVGKAMPYGDRAEMNFYFRLSSQTCDTVRSKTAGKYQGILFMVRSQRSDRCESFSKTGDDSGLLIHQAVLGISDLGTVIGGADPIPYPSSDPKYKLDCSKEISEDDGSSAHLPWWASDFKATKESGHFCEMTLLGCQADLFGGRCERNSNNKNSPSSCDFLSPADLGEQNIATREHTYKCNDFKPEEYRNTLSVTFSAGNKTEPRKFRDYIENGPFTQPCPEVAADCKNKIKEGNKCLFQGGGSGKNCWDYDEERGILVNQFGSKTLWNLRKSHGLSMVIVTLFLMPVSGFVSRYLKETHMAKRVFYQRLWYEVHTHMAGWIFVLTTSAAYIIYVSHGFLGRSLSGHADVHRIFAYVGYTVFIFTMVGSGFRHMDEGSRAYTICCHWFLGMALYVLNLGALFTSIWIPGSPSAWIDHGLKDAQKKALKLVSPVFNVELSLFLLIAWVVFDVVMHVVMTLSIAKSDSKMEVIKPRIYCPSPIPVIREDETIDASGAAWRKSMTIGYAVVSLLTTLTFIWIIIQGANSSSRGYGPMRCTHISAHGVVTSNLPMIRAECSGKDD